MGLLDGVKEALGLGAPAPVEPKKRAAYFLALIKTGEVWPEKEWDKAREIYEGDSDKHTRTNLWRGHVDTQAAFMDEAPGKVMVAANAAFSGNDVVKAAAKCDEELYTYLFDEMDFYPVIGKARHSADLTSIGFVVHGVDLRKMLPNIKFVQNEQVKVDGDCGGDLKRASWVAYMEYLSPETIVKDHPECDLYKLKKAAGAPTAPTVDPIDHAESKKISNAYAATKDIRSKCKLWRMYLRNEAALYDVTPATDERDAEGQPHFERYRDTHGMNEPRRYIEIIEGYDEPLTDQDTWPELLAFDFDEWPITTLSYNQAYERVAGFTDWRHEERLSGIYENSVADADQVMALHTPNKLGLRRGDKRNTDELRLIIGKAGLQIVPNALDEQGNPLIAPISFGNMDATHIDWIKLVKELHEIESRIPKIKQGGESTFDTATEAEIASEASNALMEIKLHIFESFQVEIARKTLAIAHRLLRTMTTVEVQDAGGVKVVDGLPWMQAGELLKVPGSALVALGVEAMVGSELATAWQEGASLDVINVNTTVSVERGSTQKRIRLQRVAAFRDIWQAMVVPVMAQLMAVEPMMVVEKGLAAADKALSMMNLGEFETLLPDINTIKANEEMRQAQQAQMAQAQAVQPASAVNVPMGI
jgi:hypothetical protein